MNEWNIAIRKKHEKEDNTPIVEVDILEWVLEATASRDLPLQ